MGLLDKYSLMLISYNTWEMLSEVKSEMLSDAPSTLIINKKSQRNRIAFEDENIDSE